MKHLTNLFASLTLSLVACATTPENDVEEPPPPPATCADTACDANATCSDASGEPVCTCNAGFTGDGATCGDVDECASGNACQAGNACVNAAGGFDCLPKSCSGVLASDPDAVDGPYTLYVGGNPAKPWEAFCAGMQLGAPVEYVSLVNILADSNFSSYTAGGASTGTTVKTSYLRLRIDPVTLAVQIGDQRFATSSGGLNHAGGGPVTSMPYGVAANCLVATPGRANIDLRGTPFAIADTFTPGGSFEPALTNTSIDPSKQFVDLSGGGGCGWNASSGAPFDPYNTSQGTLQLAYVAE